MNVAGAPGGFSIQIIIIHSPKIKPTNPGNKFYGSYEVTGIFFYHMPTKRCGKKSPSNSFWGLQALSDFAGAFSALAVPWPKCLFFRRNFPDVMFILK